MKHTIKIMRSSETGEFIFPFVSGLGGEIADQKGAGEFVKQALLDGYIGRCGGPVNTSQIVDDRVYEIEVTLVTGEVKSVKDF